MAEEIFTRDWSKEPVLKVRAQPPHAPSDRGSLTAPGVACARRTESMLSRGYQRADKKARGKKGK